MRQPFWMTCAWLCVLLAACNASTHDTASGLTAAVASVNQSAPAFVLRDTNGQTHRLSDLTADGRVVVLEWFNPDCPISKAYHVPDGDMAATAGAFADQGVTWLAINSGGPGEQGAGLDRNQRAVDDYHIPYPVLLDEGGEVGKLYGAVTTPHMFIISAEGVLLYQGAIDDGRPGRKGAINYVRQALEQHLAGQEITTSESLPFGCSVKFGS